MNDAARLDMENDPILRAATEWFFELRANDVPVERIAQWQEWLAAAEIHRRVFEQVESFWRLGAQVNPTRWPSDTEVARDTYRGDESIIQWRMNTAGRTNKRSRPYALALAASLVAAAGVLSWMLFERDGATLISTPVGETRSVTLADSSRVVVGAKTTVKVTMTSGARVIDLQEGEAFFQVAKDPIRPFTVRAGKTTVTAIGTAFNVRRVADTVVVAVAEGAVSIDAKTSTLSRAAASSTRLDAGQQLSIQNSEAAPQVLPVNTESVAGWRDGRLQYTNETLAVIVSDIARYSPRRIDIRSAEIQSLRVTGVIFQQNIDGWLASLQATMPVEVVNEVDGSVRLEPR